MPIRQLAISYIFYCLSACEKFQIRINYFSQRAEKYLSTKNIYDLDKNLLRAECLETCLQCENSCFNQYSSSHKHQMSPFTKAATKLYHVSAPLSVVSRSSFKLLYMYTFLKLCNIFLFFSLKVYLLTR
jgi:hypothetical protein